MNRFLVHAGLALLLAPAGASALDLSTRVVSPVRTWQAHDLARFSDQFVHVKFVEGSNVTLQADRFADDTGLDLGPVQAAIGQTKIVEIRPTFHQDRTTTRAWKAIAEAKSGVIAPDLSLWYTIRVNGGAEAVAKLINELNAARAVEIAHPEPIAENAVVKAPRAIAQASPRAGTPDFTGSQSYLYAPPTGLDAPAAWGHPGGFGEGGKFIDVELAWTEDHEEFPFDRLFHEGGAVQNPSYEPHGTAVLGEVIGQQNGFGINGFAPGIDGYGVVAIHINDWPVVPQYFQEAVDQLAAGDAWLIELQMFPPGRSATPMEYLQVNYDVIFNGVWSRDVICIEAGANGSQNLDDPSWLGIFDRNVRDSGAIMVAAGTPFGLVAESFTNYGTRMDVHAWGSSIVTTGYGDLYSEGPLQTYYTSSFGGTSGASPMVTGSALVLGGIARAAGVPFTPITLRTILHDTGTPYQGVRYIGPRPDLEAAVAELLQTASVVAPVTIAVPWHIESAPNPFSDSIQFRLEGPARQALRMGVYDVNGRRMRQLESPITEGVRVVAWDGRDDAGSRLGSGVYFLRIDTPGFEQSVKIQKIH
jgi:serine protease